MDLKGTKYEPMALIYLTQDRHQWRPVLNTVMNLRVP
jgi:hypothetical protein